MTPDPLSREEEARRTAETALRERTGRWSDGDITNLANHVLALLSLLEQERGKVKEAEHRRYLILDAEYRAAEEALRESEQQREELREALEAIAAGQVGSPGENMLMRMADEALLKAKGLA